MCAVLTVFRIQ